MANSTKTYGKYYDVEILIGAVPFSELEDEGDFAEISITYLIFDESRNQNGLFALALELYPEQCPEEEKMLFEKVNDLVKAHGKEYKSNDQELRDILKDIFGNEGRYPTNAVHFDLQNNYDKFKKILSIITKE